jgi:hypothetical protein
MRVVSVLVMVDPHGNRRTVVQIKVSPSNTVDPFHPAMGGLGKSTDFGTKGVGGGRYGTFRRSPFSFSSSL